MASIRTVGRFFSLARARQSFWSTIDFEPSWFIEFVSAFGIFVWGALAVKAHRHTMHGPDYFIPIIGMMFGVARVRVLFRLRTMPRVWCACGGFLWWVMICAGLDHAFGFKPGMAAESAIAFGDFLTVAKFSRWAARLPQGD